MTRPNVKLNILRVTVVLLAVALLLPCFCVAHADGGNCGEVQWNLHGSVLTIFGSGRMENFSEENPAPWSQSDVTKVVVGEGITRIGDYAFLGCDKLVSVVLPGTLERIGTKAFCGCSALGYLAFPASLRVIGDAAFEGCSSLNSIRLNQGLTTIRDHAFYRCSGLTAITVPNSVSYFGKVVFSYCEKLSQATILCWITKVPDSTFYGCVNLKNVVLPQTVSSLGTNAFYGCKELSIVYYQGEMDSAALRQEIANTSSNVSNDVEVSSEEFLGESYSTKSYGEPMDTEAVVEYSVVKETENSTVTVTVTETSTYTLNGETVTLQDAFDNMQNGANVQRTSEVETTVSGTVENDEGWSELTAIVRDISSDSEMNVTVNVNANTDTVAGQELAKLSGTDTTVTTSGGTVWILPTANERSDFGEETYSLNTTVTVAEEAPAEIASDNVFEVKFGSHTDFKTSTGLFVGFDHDYATLYQVNGKKVEKVQSTIVDNDGVAWFNLANADDVTQYFIGINVAGVTEKEVVIPPSLYEEYNIALADQVFLDGIKYAFTGRESSLGVTGAQFALYVGLAIVTVVIVVGVVMVTLNNKKIAARRAAIAHGVVPEEWKDDLKELQESMAAAKEPQKKE